MTCDDAFDRMTDARRRDDGPLAEHLAGCPRCRAMHETLAPAMSLFSAASFDRRRDSAVAVRSRSSTELAVSAARRLTQQNLVRARIAVAARRARVCAVASGTLLFVAVSAAVLSYTDHTSGWHPQPGLCPYLSRDDQGDSEASAAVVINGCIACHGSSDDPAARTIRELQIERLQGRRVTQRPADAVLLARDFQADRTFTIASREHCEFARARCYG